MNFAGTLLEGKADDLASRIDVLRDFWVSQPVLYDPKWGERDRRNGGTALEMIRAESFELAKQCDDFVKHVAARKAHQ